MQDLVDRIDKPRAAAWILYDTANTVYTATVAFLFAPFVADLFDDRSSLGATQTVSMVLAGLAVPLLGTIADKTRWARSLLWASTLLTIALIAVFGLVKSENALLAAFFCANFSFQSALVFYNALLPSVAPMRKTGLISGLGVGFGFGGTVLTLALVPNLAAEPADRFLWASILFLVGALPCLLFVRDKRDIPAVPLDGRTVVQSFKEVSNTLRTIGRNRALLLFLIGNFCLTDVLLTATLWFADYTKTTFGPIWVAGDLSLFGSPIPYDEEKSGTMNGFVATLGLTLNGSALVFGAFQGFLSDKIHPLHVLRLTGLALTGAVIAGGVFGGNSPEGYLLGMVLGGAFGMAGVQTAGRKLLLLLVPKERLGEFFGIYGITTKVSVIGSVTFGVIADRYGMKPALYAQVVQLVIGLACLFLLTVSAARAAEGQIGASDSAR